MPHSYLASQREPPAERCVVLQRVLLSTVETGRQAGRERAVVPCVDIGKLYHFCIRMCILDNTTAGQPYGFMCMHPMGKTDESIGKEESMVTMQ